MKSERRHELQTNELADWLGQHVQKVKPYSKALLGGLILILALIAVLVIVRARGQQRLAEAWNSYYAAMFNDPEDLSEVASDYSTTDASVWARLMYAENQAAQGMGLLYSDRTAGLEKLTSASDTYQTLLSQLSAEQKNDPLVAGRIHLQLGRVREALENMKSARENYELVVEKWPDHAVGERAQWALDLLGRASGQEFYAAFYAAPIPASPSQRGMGQDTGLGAREGLGPDGTEEIDLERLFQEQFGEGFPDAGTGEGFPEPGGVDQGETSPSGEELPLEGAETTPSPEGEAAPTEGTTAPSTETPAAEPETVPAETPAAETPATEPPSEEVPLEVPSSDEPPAPTQ